MRAWLHRQKTHYEDLYESEKAVVDLLDTRIGISNPVSLACLVLAGGSFFIPRYRSTMRGSLALAGAIMYPSLVYARKIKKSFLLVSQMEQETPFVQEWKAMQRELTTAAVDKRILKALENRSARATGQDEDETSSSFREQFPPRATGGRPHAPPHDLDSAVERERQPSSRVHPPLPPAEPVTHSSWTSEKELPERDEEILSRSPRTRSGGKRRRAYTGEEVTKFPRYNKAEEERDMSRSDREDSEIAKQRQLDEEERKWRLEEERKREQFNKQFQSKSMNQEGDGLNEREGNAERQRRAKKRRPFDSTLIFPSRGRGGSGRKEEDEER